MAQTLINNISYLLLLILLLFAPFVFFPLTNETEVFRLPKEVFANFIIVLIMGLWALKQLEIKFTDEKIKKIYNPRLNSIFIGIIIFVIYSFTLILLTHSPWLSLKTAFNIFSYSFLLFFIATSIATQKKREEIIDVTVFSAGVMATYSLFQYYGHDPLFKPVESYMKGFLITSGFIDNPNLFAGYISGIVPLALYLIHIKKRAATKIAICSILAILTASLIFTKSRAALLSLFISLLYFFIATQKKWSVKKILFSALIFFLTAYSLYFANIHYFSKARKDLSLSDNTMSVRLLHWQTAWHMIKEDSLTFLFGKGPGSFKLHYLDYREEALSSFTPSEQATIKFENTQHVHNEFLQLWAETGLTGVIILFTLLLLFIKESHNIRKQNGLNKKDQILIAASLSSIVALLTDSILSFPFHIVPSALTGITSAGIVLSIINQTNGDKR